jgi:serine acetyltransferase
LILNGGNIIGINKAKIGSSPSKVGNKINLGANATIIGPTELGINIKIGSLCCVTKIFVGDDLKLGGVPARQL